MNDTQETQNKDIFNNNKSLFSTLQLDDKKSQTFLSLLDKWYGENCKITKNIAENQNIFSQIHALIEEQNRVIHQLQSQISKQNEKENEYNNCKKKLEQTEKYITTLTNKHNQTIEELNQQISNLKNNNNRHFQQTQNQTTHHNHESSVSSSFSSSTYDSPVNANKILLPKQKTIPILSSSTSSNPPNLHTKQCKSLDSIDFKQFHSQSSLFVRDINNLGDSYPSNSYNSEITIMQPRISKSSRRNSLNIQNLHLHNNNHNDPSNPSLKLRKIKSENIQRNFCYNYKNNDKQKVKGKEIKTSNYDDHDYKNKNENHSHSTLIHKNKSSSLNGCDYLKNINKKMQANEKCKDQMKNINFCNNDISCNENDADNDSDLNNNDNIENELDKIQELIETISQNSDASY